MELKEKEEQLNSLAEEIFQEADRGWMPLYPWVLVRVLKREQVRNGIVLPDIDQNKTILEGIVVQTWKPVTSPRVVRSSDGKVPVIVEGRVSALKPGDHVLFPHWAGLPQLGFSERHYRLVREEDWAESSNGGIFAIVERTEGTTQQNELRDFIDSVTKQRPYLERPVPAAVHLAEALLDRYVLVDKTATSVTLSGR